LAGAILAIVLSCTMREWLAASGDPVAFERAVLSAGRERPVAWRELLVKYVRATASDLDSIRRRPDATRIDIWLDDAVMSAELARRPAAQNPWLLWLPNLTCKAVWGADQVDALRRLQEAFPTIQSEASRTLPEARTSYEQYSTATMYEGDWNIFRIIGLHGPAESARQLIPSTTKFLESLGATVAMFSRLQPGTHIKPHCSMTNGRMTCHLALMETEGCWFRVADERLGWRVGTAFAFDDSLVHEARNEGTSRRLILIAAIPHIELTTFETAFFSRLMEEVTAWFGEPPDGNIMSEEQSARP